MKKRPSSDASQPLTKSEFHALLRKAAQPIQEETEQPSQEEFGTSEHRPSDGYTSKRKSPSTTEDSGESPNG